MKKFGPRDRKAEKIRGSKRARRAEGSVRREQRAGGRRPFQTLDPSLLQPSAIGTVKIPKLFSLLEEPETALQVIDRIQKLLKNKRIRNIHIDHSACERLGLCASTVMDVLLIEGQRHRGGRRFLFFSGILSQHEDVNVMIKASGILKHLRLPEAELSRELDEKILRFELQSGRPSEKGSAAGPNKAGTDLTEYFNRCLRTQGFHLNEDGELRLSCLVTETLNNAEDHGGGPWYAIGHWDPRLGKEGDCHIVIFNFGTTIYQSLNAPDSSAILKEGLKELSDRHQRWFERNKWDEESLWTLYALQDRVTRFYKLESGRDRGNGTIKMIEFFDELAGPSNKKMCVISGSTFILFNGKYNLQLVEKDGEELKIIAFNAQNKLEQPPDGECVRQLEGRFDGTLISIKLTLDKSFLNKFTKKKSP